MKSILQERRNCKEGKSNQTKRLIDEKGSQTKRKFLHETLLQNKREADEFHEELMKLLEEDDEDFGEEWLEESSQ